MNHLKLAHTPEQEAYQQVIDDALAITIDETYSCRNLLKIRLRNFKWMRRFNTGDVSWEDVEKLRGALVQILNEHIT